MTGSSLARTTAALLTLAATAVGEITTGGVLVVDAQMGPGSDYATIAEAVAKARSRDLILVRSGRYSGFKIDRKDLRIVADEGATVEISGLVEVFDLGGPQAVLLRGFQSPPTQPFFELRGLASIGQLWLEDCQLGPPAGIAAEFARPAVFLQSMTSVAMIDCAIAGQDGSGIPQVDPSGAPAIDNLASNLWLYGCTLRGGDAFPGSGAAGGAAVVHDNFELFASDTVFIGGDGADGGACQAGGAGGDGVAALNVVSNVYFHGNSYLPGDGGLGGPCGAGFANRGPNGTRLSEGGGQSTALDGPVREFEITSPIRRDDPVFLSYGAPPGEPVLTVATLAMDTGVEYELSGVRLIGLDRTPIYRGPVPPGGVVRLDLGSTLLPPGFEFSELYVQTLFAPSGASGPILGPASSLIVLAPSL